MVDFNMTHGEYIKKALEDDKKNMDLSIDRGYDHLKKMVGWIQDLLTLYSNFKYKLQVSKLMTELRRKFGKESRARLTISSLGKVLGNSLKGSINVESVNIDGLRRNLKEEFEGVMDAVVDLKFATNNAKVSLKD